MLALVLLALQQPAAPVVATVRVTPENPIVAVGDSVHLTGVALDSAGRPLAGAEVRFFGGSFEGRVDVEVVPNAVRRLEIVGGSPSVRAGDVARFRAVARDASGRELTGLAPVWSLSPGGGLVDQDGAMVPYTAGTYTVTASLGG